MIERPYRRDQHQPTTCTPSTMRRLAIGTLPLDTLDAHRRPRVPYGAVIVRTIERFMGDGHGNFSFAIPFGTAPGRTR